MAKVKTNPLALTRKQFVLATFHVKHRQYKHLKHKVFINGAWIRPRRAAPTTAKVYDAKPSRFDRFFAQKRKKSRDFDQFLRVRFNRKLKFPKQDRSEPSRCGPKTNQRLRWISTRITTPTCPTMGPARQWAKDAKSFNAALIGCNLSSLSWAVFLGGVLGRCGSRGRQQEVTMALFTNFLKSESGAMRVDYGLLIACWGFLIFRVMTSPDSAPTADGGDALLRVN
jgi:hypothetical protein